MKSLVVYSLKYFDEKYAYKRYSRVHLIDVFFQQTPAWEHKAGEDSRTPTESSLSSKNYAPFYNTEI